MGVYGNSVKAVGESQGAVPALRAPNGCVPVHQLHWRANGDSPAVVPAPPRTAREAVDPTRCTKNGCKGLRQKGYATCAPHRVAAENRKAKAKSVLPVMEVVEAASAFATGEWDDDGDSTEH